MEQITPFGINNADTFKKKFEKNCFRLIVDAYLAAMREQRYQLNWYENSFSELLGNYVNSNPLSIKKKIFCVTERKIFSATTPLTKDFADKLARVDFSYSTHWGSERYLYYMEAKRLKEKDSDLKREYIKEGMNRFTTEKYPLGCMLGYLLEGEVEKTIKGINSLLKKDDRSTEALQLTPSDLFTSYYQSEHESIGVLKHLIFDFTNT